MESLWQYDSAPEQFDHGIEDTDKLIVLNNVQMRLKVTLTSGLKVRSSLGIR